MKKLIYLSGPITNNPNWRLDFHNKSYELESKGYRVLRPTMINCKLEYDQYMHIDLAMIDCCEAVYFMKGWEDSNGCKIEKEYAESKNIELIFE